MMNFCTLFDSFYVDKAMALYNSLEKVTEDFHLYVFCFDETSMNIINALKWKHATIISVACIENEELLGLKSERSKAEYCWTCTPIIIEYVLEHFPVEDCTYIDADLYFFSSPQILFDEIKSANADVVIVEHRFKKDENYDKMVYKAGKYCVEFNYFNKSANAKKALSWWKEKCMEWCYYKLEPERMGDQKYLEKFEELFEGVHVLSYLGAGVAPWNLAQYKLCKSQNESIMLEETDTGKRFTLVFYHFQNLRYITERLVNIKSQTRDKGLKYALYIPYLRELEKASVILKQEFGIVLERKKKYSNNWFNTFLQKYIVALKIKNISDIINLDKIRI